MTTFQNQFDPVSPRPAGRRAPPFLAELNFRNFTGQLIRGDEATCEFEFQFPNKRSLIVQVSNAYDGLQYSFLEGRGIKLIVHGERTTHFSGTWPLLVDSREYDIDALAISTLTQVSALNSPESPAALISVAGSGTTLAKQPEVHLSYAPALRRAYRMEMFLEQCDQSEAHSPENFARKLLISGIHELRAGNLELDARVPRIASRDPLSYMTPQLFRAIGAEVLGFSRENTIRLAEEIGLEVGFTSKI